MNISYGVTHLRTPLFFEAEDTNMARICSWLGNGRCIAVPYSIRLTRSVVNNPGVTQNKKSCAFNKLLRKGNFLINIEIYLLRYTKLILKIT